MAVDQSLAVASAPEVREPSEPYSADWWQFRTAEELRDIINRGFAGGQVFKSAVAEAERRAREETKRLRAVAATEALYRKKRKVIIWGGAAAVLAIAALLGSGIGL